MRLRKSTILKWSLLTLLLCYSCWITVWAHREAATHVCTGIEVSVAGQSRMDSVVRNGVTEELRDYPERIVGAPLNRIDTRKIEKYLERLGNFERVDCVLTAGGTLKVEAVPLVPVMRVFFADNSYYINKDGRHIASNAEFFTDVPVVIGRFTHGFQPRDVLPLVRYAEKDPDLRELMSTIVAESADNLIIVPRIKGHVVNFGDTTRLAEKTKALMLFYKKVMPYKGWNEYDTISVKFKGQVVATRRDKTRLNHAEEVTEDVDPEEGTLPEHHDPQAEAQKQEPDNKPENAG
jgi:hypothetical protein